MRRRGVPLLGLTALAALLIGCSTAAPPVHVDNLTDVPMALYVNGALAETLEPGASSDVPVGGTEKPPFSIEARTPSGTAIAWWTISAAQYATAASGGVGQDTTTAFPCGTIRFIFGTPPKAPPAVVSDMAPGPCP